MQETLSRVLYDPTVGRFVAVLVGVVIIAILVRTAIPIVVT